MVQSAFETRPGWTNIEKFYKRKKFRLEKRMSTEKWNPIDYYGPLSSPSCSPCWSPMLTDSDPPSPASSWVSDVSDDSEVAVDSRPVVTKRSSNPDQVVRRTFVTKKPKFATKYDEMLQPLSPITMLPFESLSLPPQRPDLNSQHQVEFRDLLSSNSKLSDVKAFLDGHSQTIDINEYNSEGRTAFQQCCYEGNLPVARLLVRYGADSNLTTREGFSALHIAAFSGHSNVLMYVMSLRR